ASILLAARLRAVPSSKHSLASSTGICKTSLILRSPRRYSNTEAWKRSPSHSSQVTATPAMMARSVYTTPAPLQLGHAPSELGLNNAGLTSFALANALRMGSSTPVYVAGLLRREPLICV